MNKLLFILLLAVVSVLFASQEFLPTQVIYYENQDLASKKAVLNNFGIDKRDLNQAQRKLSTDLLGLLDLTKDFKPEVIASNLEKFNQLRYQEGSKDIVNSEIYVYIYFYKNKFSNVIDEYCTEIKGKSAEFDYLASWVRTDRLLEIADHSEVRLIRPVMPPHFYTGSVTTQGDVIHRTAEVRSNYNQYGTCIRVGVITDGVDSRAEAQATGDLPPDGDGLYVLQNNYGGDEGTALLEIIHDMVPGAGLYFHDCGLNTIQFNYAVDQLLAAGCNVICDDVGWLTEPFFEDGVVAQHYSDIINSREDVIFTSSAGNAGQTHNQSFFYPCSGDPAYHDFSAGTTEFTDLYLHLDIGENVIVILQWNDPFGNSNNDYNLYLYSLDQSEFVTGSTIAQNGVGYDPLEYFIYQEDGTYAGDFAIKVHQYDAVDKVLEVYIYPGGDYTENIVYANNISPVDAIFGHASVPGVIATGAVHTDNLNTIAPYSSQGPTLKFTYDTLGREASQTFNTPFVVGVAGVYITGAGGFGQQDPYGNYWFYGTSASAPHSAGLVAQIWSETTPTNTTAASITYMVSGSLGSYDPVFGHGLSDAEQSFEDWLPDPNYTLLNTPNISGDMDDDLYVNIVTGPGTTANLQDSQISAKLQGIEEDNADISVESIAISPTGDNSAEVYFDFTGVTPLQTGAYELGFTFMNEQVSRTVSSTHNITPSDQVPRFEIISQGFDQDEGQVSFTIEVSQTSGTQPTSTGLLFNGLNEFGQVSGLDVNHYLLDFQTIPGFRSRKTRDIGDWILYILFGPREFSYNISQKILLTSSPQSPANLKINVVGTELVISWDEVPDCTYSVYSTTNPYESYSSWNVEVEGLTTTSWSEPANSNKKYYFVKAVLIE